MSTTITDDDRAIECIYLPQGEDHYRVGVGGVTRIEAYDENGEMAHVPWLAVYKGEEVAVRSPARHWIIEYDLNN